VKAPYFLVGELAPLMAKRGKGAIVNLSTMAADYGAPGMSLYGSSKAAINLLTKTWTAECGPSGVRVNAALDPPAPKVGMQWARVLSSWPHKDRRVVQLQPTKQQKQLSSWRQTAPVLSMVRSSP